LNYKMNANSKLHNQVRLLLANNEQLPYKGIVETIEGEFDNETGNIAFRAKFPNPNGLLKHGETGKVLMTVPLRNAVVIPQKATYEIQDKVYVFVVDKNNIVKSKNVIISNEMPDLYVVSEGLSENDKILLEGVQKVKDDDKIEYAFIQPQKVVSNLKLYTE